MKRIILLFACVTLFVFGGFFQSASAAVSDPPSAAFLSNALSLLKSFQARVFEIQTMVQDFVRRASQQPVEHVYRYANPAYSFAFNYPEGWALSSFQNSPFRARFGLRGNNSVLLRAVRGFENYSWINLRGERFFYSKDQGKWYSQDENVIRATTPWGETSLRNPIFLFSEEDKDFASFTYVIPLSSDVVLEFSFEKYFLDGSFSDVSSIRKEIEKVLLTVFPLEKSSSYLSLISPSSGETFAPFHETRIRWEYSGLSESVSKIQLVGEGASRLITLLPARRGVFGSDTYSFEVPSETGTYVIRVCNGSVCGESGEFLMATSADTATTSSLPVQAP